MVWDSWVVEIGSFPRDWQFTIRKPIDEAVHYLTVNPNFYAFTTWLKETIFYYILNPLETFFTGLPWFYVLAGFAFISYFSAGKWFALVAFCLLFFTGLSGVWLLTMETLAAILASVAVCVIIRLPLGIFAAYNKTVDQTVNGSQFYFVSQDNRTNYVLRSTMRSTDSDDDDDMGFVVGWANDENHILFRWDAADVNGGIRGGVRSLEYILNRSATVLAQESVRWTRNYTYQVLISYTDQNIQVEIDNSTVFNVSASQFSSISSFPTGKFGFYNLSQGGVTYGNVQTGVATVTSGGTAD